MIQMASKAAIKGVVVESLSTTVTGLEILKL